ncbi:MAG TPA: hypothetical protein ENK44_08070 [Caldithrix abyssi]|uniref:Photosynthesis system II assembly factor Ycf48/Hcf136-like domain-containing protein n=1 Tax=Caldithrix abyssi TaxID=187145 RepID=A0A7V4WUY3_CALAY|nr:hypothetical protein [Caldithrix abyssi]
MNKYFLLLIQIVPLIYFGSCQKSTEPVTNNTGPDTTGHDFTFVIDTLGNHPDSIWVDPSILWDVFIVNENDVWVVGEINTVDTGFDSLGHFTPPYSAAHWDGEKWEYVRFKWKPQNTLNPVYSIWIFSESEMWIAAAGIFKKVGDSWVLKYKNNPDAGEIVTKLWAASEDEIYAVGRRGIIVKYDGNSWTRMESGTDVDLLNVWGGKDAQTGETHVFAAGSRGDREYGVVLELKDGQWLSRFDAQHPVFGKDDDHTHPDAIWLFKDSVYTTFAGYYDSYVIKHDKNNYSTNLSKIHLESQGAIMGINGNDYNDIFFVGYRDVVLHYNGKSFKKYFQFPYVDARYYSVKQKGDYVFACGEIFGYSIPIVLRGKRNH